MEKLLTGLDFCFMPMNDEQDTIPASLVADFLSTYYSILSNKPKKWVDMIEDLRQKETISLLPL